MNDCTLGKILNTKCHLETYTRSTGIKDFFSLSNEEQEKTLWRCGLPELQFSCDKPTICYHHELVYGRVFERRVSDKCCDIYERHKKKVKGGHSISLEMAKKLKGKGFSALPGFHLCRGCLEKFLSDSDTTKVQEIPLEEQNVDNGNEMFVDDEEGGDPDVSRERLNRSFDYAGVSPVKLHGLSKSRQVSGIKDKLKRPQTFQEKQAAKVIGVEIAEMKEPSVEEELKNENLEKATELDKLHYLLKEKIQISSKKERIKLLTLAPDSWSRKKAADFFNVSEYCIRAARELKRKKGILAEPDKSVGKPLSDAVIDAVKAFYQEDEYSRMMPGQKDFVSIGRGIHMQKRLLLCNLSELYSAFKQKYSSFKVGFSKFCSLRPKWCVLTGASGTHSVCVCSYHQNAILLSHAISWDFTYKDLMKKVVCSTEERECMVHRCSNCPGKDALKDFLTSELSELEDDVIHYQQWQSTDRATLTSCTSGLDEYVEILSTSIDQLTSHSYIAKCQAQYLKYCKESLNNSTCIMLLDFAENYKYDVQDEIQSFHWNNQQCTLHPVVLYYFNQENALEETSLCIISDDNDHDTCFVHQVQRIAVGFIKDKMPNVTFVKYFSDGCGGQYKNYKNFVNLYFHKDDFGIDADWTFFVTSHGKSPCDGIGGTVKRLVARASLQRPFDQQILSFESMIDFCTGNIKSIHFETIFAKDMEAVCTIQNIRFELGKALPGTRSYHYFKPVDNGNIKYKRTSYDPEFQGEFSVTHQLPVRCDIDSLRVSGFLCCTYDNFWWICIIDEIDIERKEVYVNFMHPHGPVRSFTWPRRSDKCWVPIDNVICKVDAPSTTSGRTYAISD